MFNACAGDSLSENDSLEKGKRVESFFRESLCDLHERVEDLREWYQSTYRLGTLYRGDGSIGIHTK